MNRRPAAFLFLSAMLGAFFGSEIISAQLAFIACLSLVPVIFLLPLNSLKITAFLLFTFFITAYSASIHKERFVVVQSALPQGEAIFLGTVTQVSPKEDGSQVLLARVKVMQGNLFFNLMLHLKDALAAQKIVAGQSIQFKGNVHPFSPPLSSVLFDGAMFGFTRTIHGKLTISNPSFFMSGTIRAQSFFIRQQELLRDRIVKALTPKEASTVLALIIGDTAFFSKEQKEIYETIGAQHLLAVSGLQVSMLAFLCFLLVRPFLSLMLPMRWFHHAYTAAGIITLVFGLWFIGLSSFQSSAIRALLMSTALLLPYAISRRVDSFDAIYASGLITILFSPVSIFDLGFLLSYASVFGLLVAHERSRFIRERLRATSIVVAQLFALSIGATAAFLATLPVIALGFQVFAPYSVLVNLFLVPIAALCQIPVIVFGLMGAFIDSSFFIELAGFFGNTIEISAEFFAHAIGERVYLPSLPPFSLMLALLGLNLGFFYVLKPKAIPLMVALLLMTCPFLLSLFDRAPLEVTVIPVGQGDATLFTFSNGQTLLIDAGGSMQKDFDPGLRIVLPTLKRKGINNIDVLAISHPDPDHINGAFALIDALSVKEIWHSGFKKGHHMTKKLIEKANDRHIAIKTTNEILGSHRFGLSEVQVLGPQTFQNDPYFSELPANDNSLVLRIVHNKFALLWPGDLEYFGERLLIDSAVDISAQILKAPHHGSKTSSSPQFIERVNPQHVIYSTGLNNRFKFPHENVMTRYQSKNVVEWNTAIDGEIAIKIDHNKIAIEGFRKPFKEKNQSVPST